MEPSRFDHLARRVTRARSRRGVLGVLGSAALAIGVSLARPQPAEARCRHGLNCSKSRSSPCKDNDNPDCIRAKNVDTGRCACMGPSLCTDPCKTGTDCASGLCVFGKGCCNDKEKFCANPCPTV